MSVFVRHRFMGGRWTAAIAGVGHTRRIHDVIRPGQVLGRARLFGQRPSR